MKYIYKKDLHDIQKESWHNKRAEEEEVCFKYLMVSILNEWEKSSGQQQILSRGNSTYLNKTDI